MPNPMPDPHAVVSAHSTLLHSKTGRTPSPLPVWVHTLHARGATSGLPLRCQGLPTLQGGPLTQTVSWPTKGCEPSTSRSLCSWGNQHCKSSQASQPTAALPPAAGCWLYVRSAGKADNVQAAAGSLVCLRGMGGISLANNIAHVVLRWYVNSRSVLAPAFINVVHQGWRRCVQGLYN